jgi:hypothetical protein
MNSHAQHKQKSLNVTVCVISHTKITLNALHQFRKKSFDFMESIAAAAAAMALRKRPMIEMSMRNATSYQQIHGWDFTFPMGMSISPLHYQQHSLARV